MKRIILIAALLVGGCASPPPQPQVIYVPTPAPAPAPPQEDRYTAEEWHEATMEVAWCSAFADVSALALGVQQGSIQHSPAFVQEASRTLKLRYGDTLNEEQLVIAITGAKEVFEEYPKHELRRHTPQSYREEMYQVCLEAD